VVLGVYLVWLLETSILTPISKKPNWNQVSLLELELGFSGTGLKMLQFLKTNWTKKPCWNQVSFQELESNPDPVPEPNPKPGLISRTKTGIGNLNVFPSRIGPELDPVFQFYMELELEPELFY
jgi:hypothetical protein